MRRAFWPEWLWLIGWLGTAFAVNAWEHFSTSIPPPPLPLQRALGAPSWPNLCGFDAFGRDMLMTVLRAAGASSLVSIVASATACVAALTIGGGIAILPERLRFGALRALDAWLAFPFLLIALGWAAVRGPGWSTLLISLLIGLTPSFARLVYARTREIMAEPFIEAADSLGASPPRILIHHIAPNLMPLVRAKAPLLFAQCLMAEAALSFLGVGAPIGSDTWGSLLAWGKDYLIEAPHIALTAGVPLVFTILALQSLSAGQND